MIKYIITDFDGTLVDTMKANMAAYTEAFEESGYGFSDKFGRYGCQCQAKTIYRIKKMYELMKEV